MAELEQTNIHLSEREKAAELALWSVPGIGLKHFWQILWGLKHYQIKTEEFWVGPERFFSKLLISEKIAKSILKFNNEHNFYEYYQELLASGVFLLHSAEDDYPKLLTQTDERPPFLFGRAADPAAARLLINQQPQLAVVGTRRMTAYGVSLLEHFIPDLVAAGILVVSGFMSGVDVAAQKCSLAHGGKTLAFLGYGFDHCFPRSQERLFAEFLEQGAIFLTEYPPSVAPKAGNFVQRNRLIAGTTLGTLVVEAAIRSGSHITAHFANDYGRLVFAVPGPVSNPYSEGTKFLLTQGAIPVTSAKDILAHLAADYHLPFVRGAAVSQLSGNLAPAEQKVLQFLAERGALSFSELVAEINLPFFELSLALLNLEVQGKIDCFLQKYSLSTRKAVVQ